MTEVELHGGPLDGWRVEVDETDDDPWIAIVSELGAHPGGRSLYAPGADGRWVWVRDLRWDEL
ncbi:hypothetical protein [Streptomyces sp. AC1-42T]|uniref:hypothetical protein n=1 Tax=Streptomyces sp. AC1-42T TaxID=2218665 RepID=UPI000DAB610E|nr:hypothetical protein [Streptomyces sp. AC1-42T]PZT71585.1 hypothetical protein DNK55_32660 [Streptomyces sp. AC1-42T]